MKSDTDPRAEEVMLEHLRRMTPSERLHRACELRAAALTLARARIRRWYGPVGEREMQMRLAAPGSTRKPCVVCTIGIQN